jgi:penicillin amidase
LALRWVAHDPSNEVLMWLKLNRAKNYNDYLTAIKVFSAPGQNMLFASKSGDIAIWQQARFPARWQGQGLYIMPGEDTSYAWQGFIPQEENPHLINPSSGFIQSANQRPVDSTYPYFIPGDYFAPRGISITRKLEAMQQITPQDMMRLQIDDYDAFAAMAAPLLTKQVNASMLDNSQRKYLSLLQQWDFYAAANAQAATVFQKWWDTLKVNIWSDEFSKLKNNVERPEDQTLLELLLKDSALSYIDDITTPQRETLQQQVQKSLKAASVALQQEEKVNNLLWWKHKNTTISHLLRKSAMPFARAGLKAGGWKNAINAQTETHGPSWRMIVHLTTPTEAYGVYPGGQSGNPGSRFYDSFVDTWAIGKYYKLWMMAESEKEDKRIKWKLTFTNS